MNDDSNQTSASCVTPFQVPFAKLLARRWCGWGGGIDDYCAADDLNQRIAGNPFESHAGAGRSFPRAEVGPVDLVQRVVLRFMCIETCLTGRHWDAIGERKTEKDLEIDNAVHGAACTLDRLLERVHRAGDVLFEGISYENVIVLGIAVIGTSTREVVDAILCVIAAGTTRPVTSRSPHGCAPGRECATGRSLLSEEF